MVNSHCGERYGKDSENCQTTVQKATEREPLMTCRKGRDDVKTGVESKRCTEALTWNLGTCRLMLREKFKEQTFKNQRTDAGTGADQLVVAMKPL